MGSINRKLSRICQQSSTEAANEIESGQKNDKPIPKDEKFLVACIPIRSPPAFTGDSSFQYTRETTEDLLDGRTTSDLVKEVLRDTSNQEASIVKKFQDINVSSSNISSQEVQEEIRRNLERIKNRVKNKNFVLNFSKSVKKLNASVTTPNLTQSCDVLTKTICERGSHLEFVKETNIYVVKTKQNPVTRNMFPKRNRRLNCYLCGIQGDDLIKCGSSACHVQYHEKCVKKSTVGGYTYAFMNRNNKIFCSMHHCTACFADHNRSRCFNGELINCDQCELAWHVNCIPGGCEIDAKRTITCPRHVSFQDAPKLHVRHCADCQQEAEAEDDLIKCTKCFRAIHLKCYGQTKPGSTENIEKEREQAICHWCAMFDFIRYGEFAMARFSHLKWYPCQVVSNSEFPKNNPLLGTIGYVCVKWLPYKGKTFFNLVSHNRIIAMTVHDYYYTTLAKKSDIYKEWKEAQKETRKNNSLHREITLDQIPDKMMSNGERIIRKINRNKYSKPELKTPRERLYQVDTCTCLSNAKDRCGPSSNCINRMLGLECPKECGEVPNKSCNNRRISEGKNCISVKIEYFYGKGYGAIALEDVPKGGFVGEYVGEIIDEEEKKLRVERIAARQSNEAQYYIMHLDDKRAIDAQYYGNDMRYVNHSCNPNCIIQDFQSDFDIHLMLIAKRPIKKGEELSFDYNMKGSGRELPVCHCKEANCTKKLSAEITLKRKSHDREEENKLPSSSNNASAYNNRHREQGSSVSLAPVKMANRNSFSSSAPTKRKSTESNSKEPVKRAKTLK